MPIRRSALSALCLVIFGAATLQGQPEDPFAEWDRQNSRSTPKRAAQKEPKSSVTYFSPSTEEAVTPEKSGKTVAPAVQMREKIAGGSAATSSVRTPAAGSEARTKSKAVSNASMSASAAKPAKPEASGLKTTKSTTGSAAKAPVAAEDSTKLALKGKSVDSAAGKTEPKKATVTEPKAAGPAIRNASMTAEAGESKAGMIKQVSGSEENPFAEFLKNSEPPVAQEKPAEEDAFQGMSEEDQETAEALFSGSTKSQKPVAPAAGPKTPIKPVSSSVADAGMAQPASMESPPKTNEGPQSPGVTVQWVRRGSFNVGQECDVDLVVQNTSKAVLRSVMTEAVLPAEVEVVEANPEPMQGSETPTWTFGEMKPGETRTVAMKLIPRARGDVRLDAFVRLTGSSSTAFSVQEPMLSVAVAGPEAVEVGEQVAYVVKVTNPGTGVANNVVIQAAVPEGLEHRSGSILSIEIGTLSAGESRQAKLSLNAVKGGEHKLAVRAIADGDLTDETVADVMVSEPQLNIMIAGPEEQMTGRTSDFKMTVTNSGNVPSENVRAKYRVPEGFEFVSADRGGKYSKVDHSVEWFVGTLQPEEESDFQLTLRATDTGDLVHQAGVISEHGQVTMCDYATTVEGMAALDLKISASDKELTKGEEVTWEVRISNTGSRSATNVGMSCELPSGIQLVDATGPSEHIAENGIMVFRSLPNIEPGAEIVYTITGHCLRAGNHRLRMRVASESISEPLIGEESATISDR